MRRRIEVRSVKRLVTVVFGVAGTKFESEPTDTITVNINSALRETADDLPAESISPTPFIRSFKALIQKFRR